MKRYMVFRHIPGGFACFVSAETSADALKIARKNGHDLHEESVAVEMGEHGSHWPPGEWEANPIQWPDQGGLRPLVGKTYSVGCSCKNVAASTSPEVALLIAAAPELYAALSAVEWVEEVEDGGWFFCPKCLKYKQFGHTKNCPLNAALKKARGES